MVYKLKNGKNKIIPDEEIENNMRYLHLSRDEAIQVWLEDEGIEINPEQEALVQKAKENRITATIHQARADKPKTQRERVVKPDLPKETLIAEIAKLLDNLGCVNVETVNKTKLITFQYGDDSYKVDLSRKNQKLAEKRAKERK